MKETKFSLTEIQKDIDNFHKKMKIGSENEKIKTIVNHLKYITELFEEGYIGYLLYPYLVTSLIQYEKDVPKFVELNKITWISGYLELPNEILKERKINIKTEQAKMIRLIKSL